MELRSDASAEDPHGGSRQGITQARARAAFLQRIGGPAVDAGQLLARVDGVARSDTGLLGVVLGAVAGRGGEGPGADRTAGALTALAAYGALAAHRPERPAAEQSSVCAEQTSVWGLDLATGSLLRVPREDAFGAPPLPRPPFRPPVGAAAGLTWISAVETGLAQHCEVLLGQQSRVSAEFGPARPVEALRAHGRAPVAVLLDHDPRAVAILPYLVRIALLETAG